jgi:hypothetical protein
VDGNTEVRRFLRHEASNFVQYCVLAWAAAVVAFFVRLGLPGMAGVDVHEAWRGYRPVIGSLMWAFITLGLIRLCVVFTVRPYLERRRAGMR